MGFFEGKSERLIRIAMDGRLDGFARRNAIRDLGRVKPAPAVLDCLASLALDPRTANWIDADGIRHEAAMMLGISRDRPRVLAWLKLIETAARLPNPDPRIFGTAAPDFLLETVPKEAPAAFARIARIRLPQSAGADPCVAPLEDLLRGMKNPDADAALAEIRALYETRIDAARDRALASRSLNEVDAIIAHLFGLNSPAAHAALRRIRGMPSRQLTWGRYGAVNEHLYSNSDDAPGGWIESEVSSAAVGLDLPEPLRERWKAVKPG